MVLGTLAGSAIGGSVHRAGEEGEFWPCSGLTDIHPSKRLCPAGMLKLYTENACACDLVKGLVSLCRTPSEVRGSAILCVAGGSIGRPRAAVSLGAVS